MLIKTSGKDKHSINTCIFLILNCVFTNSPLEGPSLLSIQYLTKCLVFIINVSTRYSTLHQCNHNEAMYER